MSKKPIISPVPYFPQEHAQTCGLASLRMILSCYGDDVAEKELLKSVKLHSYGVFTTDVGLLALERGYQVRIYTCHLPLLGSQKLPFGTKITATHLRRMVVKPSHRMVYESWRRYLKKGGQLIWELPRASLLEDWLKKGVPCLINFNTAATGRFHRHWDNGHQVVVAGMDAQHRFVLLDPDPEGDQAKLKMDSEVLLPAWAINAARSSGYLMVILEARSRPGL